MYLYQAGGNNLPRKFCHTLGRVFLAADLQAGDNTGQMTAVFNISGGAVGVPEPGTQLLPLIGPGLLFLARGLQA